MMKKVARGLGFLMAAVLFCGCAEKKIAPPPVEDVAGVIHGQKIEIGSRMVSIDRNKIEDLEIAEMVRGPGDKSATAILRFVYSVGADSYQVEGVVSYERNADGTLASPMFEVTRAEETE